MTTPTIPTAPHRLPLAGHVFWLMHDLLGALKAVRAEGDIVLVHLGRLPVHVVSSPELVRQILVAESDKFGKGRFFDMLRPVVGNGIATSDGEFHLRQKRLLMPTFRPDRLRRYVQVMREQTEVVTGRWTPGGRIDADRAVHELNFRIVCRALFHSESGERAVAIALRWLPVFSHGLTRQAIGTDLLNRLPTPGNRRFQQANRRLTLLLDEVIREHQVDLTDRGDVLSTLVSSVDEVSGAVMSDQQLRDELVTILLAGTGATTPALAWLFYELARNPGLDARLQAEPTEVLGGRPVTFDDVDSLVLTRRLIRETLRRYSPLTISMRRATTEVRIGGHVFPAGAEFLFSPTMLHRDVDLYPAPVTFDPDRWAVEPSRNTYMPFGAGRHRCIGEHFALTEMAVVLATVARTWRLEPVPGHRTREVAALTLHPDRIPMRTLLRTASPTA